MANQVKGKDTEVTVNTTSGDSRMKAC